MKGREERLIDRVKRDLPSNEDSNSSIDSKITGIHAILYYRL